MSSGLEARAKNLAVLLSPLRVRQEATTEQPEIDAHLKWPATHVLADLLSISHNEGALSRDDADELLRAAGYNLTTFEEKSWLRWVLGRLEIPLGVGVAVAGVESGRPPGRVPVSELQAIAPVIARAHAHNDGKPIVSKDAAQSILAHYPNAPTLEELARNGTIIINDSDITLDTHAALWTSYGERIAALLWSRDPTSELSRWMTRIRSTWCIGAPEHLARGQRDKLLDAMVSAIEMEPDLKNWTDEISHIAPDVGSLNYEVRSVAPPRPTQLARWQWWRHLRSEGGRCRRRLACLVMSVVRHDSSLGDHPFSRIRRLFSNTPKKAWLAQVLPSDLRDARPEALASLSVDPENAVLAMSLLDSLHIANHSWDSAAHKGTQRVERYRTAIWREMLSLFVSGLANRGGEDHNASRNCIELLSYMQLRSTQGGFLLDPAQREIHDSEVNNRLHIFSLTLSEMTLPYRRDMHSARYLPRALPTLAAALRESIREEPDEARRLSLLFRVFEWAVAENQQSLAESLAVTISEELNHWLSNDLRNGAVDTWFDDELSIADLPWQKVFLASPDATNSILDGVELHKKDVAAILGELRCKDPAQNSDSNLFDEYQLRSTLIRKRRLYLALLLHALERVPSSSRVVRQSPARLELRLQQRTLRFLSEDATDEMNVFSGAPYVPANSELLATALHVVEKIPSETILADWILKDDDPFLVLSILAESRSSKFRVVAEERFSLIDWEMYLARQTYWPTMFTLARLAIASGKLEIAAFILEKDAAPSPREDQSFVPRLMLASARGDRIEDVVLPRGSNGRERDLVAFFQGLRELSTHPEAAVSTYKELVHRGTHIAESAVNLFCARLRVAADMKDVDERVSAIASALGEWNETVPGIPRRDLQKVAWLAHQNELYALHQLGLHADFWRLWNELPIEETASEPFVQIALVAGAGGADQHTHVLERAIEFHGEPMPEWLCTLRLETDEGKRRTLAPPRATQLSDDEIRAVYSECLRRPITSKAKIFSSLADTDLDSFLLNLHLNAAGELQRLEGVIGQLAEEDKFSDVMIALLRSSCRTMGVTIHAQDRGGLSGGEGGATKRGGVGERDWTVQADAVVVAVVEAMQLPSTSRVIQQHLKKLLERYDRAGLPRAFMLLYVRSDDFDATVAAYQESVQSWSGIEAPLVGGVEMHAKPAAYLKVLRTTHRRGKDAETIVFHVLVRIPRR